MAKLDFPDASYSPWVAPNNVIYTYIGTSPNGYWEANTANAATNLTAVFVERTGSTMTGALKLDNAGSVSLPDISFDGDVNTGLFQPGADSLAITTGGTQRVTVNSSGNVGIGTSSPYSVSATSNSLNIANTSSSAEINFLSSTTGFNSLYFGDGAGGTDRYRGYLEYAHNGDYMRFATGTVERLRIDSSGNVGIGTSSPSDTLHLNGATGYGLKVTDSSSHIGVYRTHSDGAILKTASNHALLFGTNDTERMRIDSSGKLLVGTSTSNGSAGSKLEVAKQTMTTSDMGLASFQLVSTSSRWPQVFIEKSRGSAVGDKDLVSNGDSLGELAFRGSDGTNYLTGASIIATVNGTTGTNDLPTDLRFSTTADGASSAVERMRIDSSGRLLLGTTTVGFNTVDNLTIADSGNCGITIRSGASSSGSIYFADGTTGSAEYEGFIDYQQAAGNLRFGTGGGQERMRIDSSGRVGVSRTSPFSQIHAYHATDNTILTLESGDSVSRINFIDSAGHAFIGNEGSDIVLATSSAATERVRIDSSGNVGIGTASPGAILHLSSADPVLRITDSSGTSSNLQGQVLFQAGVGGSAVGKVGYTGSDAVLRVHTTGAQPVAFGTNDTERMRIDSSGNLLVGTTVAFTRASIATSKSATSIGSDYNPGILNIQNTSATNGNLSLIGFQDASAFVNVASIGAINNTHSTSPNSTSGSLGFYTKTIGVGYVAERMRIDSSGNVGIGTSSPTEKLSVNGKLKITNDIILAQTSGRIDYDNGNSSGALRFHSTSANSERLRIDSSGRLLVGTSSNRGNWFNNSGWGGPLIQLESTSSTASAYSVTNSANNANAPLILLGKNRSGTIGGNAVVQSGDSCGQISFFGNDGSQMVEAARINVAVDGTPGANDLPARLVFSTTADGASSPTERMRIHNDGRISTGTTGNPGTTNFGFSINRTGSQGLLESFRNVGSSDQAAIIGGNAGEAYINGDGSLKNTNNSYGAISDIKLKENIVDASSQWGDLKALQARNYSFKPETGYSTHTQIGLIAQEVELVSPGLVSESPDRDADGNDLGTVTKSINYSVLYMKAVKALQEAMERIETLEQRLSDAGIA